MADTPNIVGLPTKPDDLLAAVEQTRRNEPLVVEMAGYYARVRWAYYLAYKEAGFADAEALELCKKAPF